MNTPILFETKEDCCGCTACYSICPVHAIQMIEDDEGFEYPVISQELCIGCKRCVQVCPIGKSKKTESQSSAL